MDREKWRRIRPILDRALAVEDEQREELLKALPEDDQALLRSMIQAYDNAPDSFEASNTTETRTSRPNLQAGDRVGPYKIRQSIGEGAFGQVYEAERTDPVFQRVAVKIIAPGMNTSQVLARFEAEQQALALMHHENVARVFDVGVTRGGRPYFVMEYINGLTITRHCDKFQLGLAERLDLFLAVCEGVHHAHQKGIIHRDLKPGNILVAVEDGKAIPKIIDFGVAKALNQPLTRRTLFTERGQLVGTPEYMPPEQTEASALGIDVRADVYSLGVLLYELLTGSRPLQLRDVAFNEVVRIICEVEPAKPSTKISMVTRSSADQARQWAQQHHVDPRTLTRRIRGDLDWITMRCLEKDRARRYGSATALADDLRRHLNSEPVLAGPPSATYRLGKFARRHRGGLAVAALLAVVVLAASIVTAAAWTRTRIFQGQENVRRAAELVDQARVIAFRDPDDAWLALKQAATLDPDNVDVQIEQIHLLTTEYSDTRERALEQVRALIDQNPASDEARALLAGLLREGEPERSAKIVNELRGRMRPAWLDYYLSLGEGDDLTAVKLLSSSLEDWPWNFKAMWERALRLDRLSLLTDDELRSRLTLIEDNPVLTTLFAVSGEEANSGADPVATLRLSIAKVLLRDADLLARDHPISARALDLNGTVLYEREEFAAAQVAYSKALLQDPSLCDTWHNRGIIFEERGKLKEAADDYEAAFRCNPVDREDLRLVGELRRKLGDLDRAESSFREVLERARSALEAVQASLEPEDGAIDLLQQEVADVNNLIGQIQLIRGDLDSAREFFNQALVSWPTLPPAHFNLGRVAMLEGRVDEALLSFVAAVEAPPAVGRKEQGRVWHLGPGLAHWRAGRLDEAMISLNRVCLDQDNVDCCLLVWEVELERKSPSRAAAALERIAKEAPNEFDRRIAAVLDGRGDAEGLIRSAVYDIEKARALYYLGSLARSEGRIDEAAEWYRKCVELQAREPVEYDLARWQLQRMGPRAPGTRLTAGVAG